MYQRERQAMEARRHLLHTCDVERSVLSLHTHVDTLSDAREGQSWVIGDITVTSVRRGKGSGCAWVWVGGLFGYNVSPTKMRCQRETRTSLRRPPSDNIDNKQGTQPDGGAGTRRERVGMGHARGPSLYCVRSAELPENLTGSCRVAVQGVIK